MITEVIVAIITAGFALIGTIITVVVTSNRKMAKMETAMKVNQAISDTKLDELTREVREHNGFARRMPVLEEKVASLEKRVSKVENNEN